MIWKGGRPILFVPFVVAALAGCAATGARGGGAMTNAAAGSPDWRQVQLADLDNRPVTLDKVLEGRPALVNLWAPWCERCKVELADLERVARQLDGCAVIVGVAVGEGAAQTATYVHGRGLSYPQVVDEGFHLADALRQNRIPTMLVIDSEGAIVHVGLALDDAALGALKAVLGRAEMDGHCKGGRSTGAT